MDVEEDTALFRRSLFHEALATLFKLGAHEEEHILTTTDTDQELTMVVRVHTKKESSD